MSTKRIIIGDALRRPPIAGKEPALTDPDNRIDVTGPSDPHRRPRQQRALDTKAKILQAAARSFAINGYAATSMNDIVAEAASTKGAVYFHFDSKEEIARELVDHWSTALLRTLHSTDGVGVSPLGHVAMFFNGLGSLVASDGLVRAGLRLTTETGLDVAQHAFGEWVDLASQLVAAAIAEKQIPDNAASQRLAMNLCAGFIGSVQVIRILGDAGDFTSRIEDLLSVYLPLDS